MDHSKTIASIEKSPLKLNQTTFQIYSLSTVHSLELLWGLLFCQMTVDINASPSTKSLVASPISQLSGSNEALQSALRFQCVHPKRRRLRYCKTAICATKLSFSSLVFLKMSCNIMHVYVNRSLQWSLAKSKPARDQSPRGIQTRIVSKHVRIQSRMRSRPVWDPSLYRI